MTSVSPAVEGCPACGARPSSPLLCEGCGQLLEPRNPPTPFAVLGLETAFAIDPALAKQRLLALSRALHPDFHAQAEPGTRRLAEDNTAALNAAYQVLVDDFRRADWLVRALRGPREDEERAMPGVFLQQVLEWNEAIEEARASAPGSPARAALAPLTEDLRAARAQGMQRIARLLTPLPEPGAPALRGVRQELNALRYLDRVLRELGELRLSDRT
jgi:molecular chaperone HscB